MSDLIVDLPKGRTLHRGLMLAIALALFAGTSGLIAGIPRVTHTLIKVNPISAGSNATTKVPPSGASAKVLQPDAALAARLARVRLALNPLSKQQLARVRAAERSRNGFTAMKALRMAETSQPDATSFAIYLGSFTDYTRQIVTYPGESGRVVQHMPVYLILVKQATVHLHGPPCMVPCPNRIAVIKIDVVIVYSAADGAFVVQSTL